MKERELNGKRVSLGWLEINELDKSPSLRAYWLVLELAIQDNNCNFRANWITWNSFYNGLRGLPYDFNWTGYDFNRRDLIHSPSTNRSYPNLFYPARFLADFQEIKQEIALRGTWYFWTVDYGRYDITPTSKSVARWLEVNLAGRELPLAWLI